MREGRKLEAVTKPTKPSQWLPPHEPCASCSVEGWVTLADGTVSDQKCPCYRVWVDKVLRMLGRQPPEKESA